MNVAESIEGLLPFVSRSTSISISVLESYQKTYIELKGKAESLPGLKLHIRLLDDFFKETESLEEEMVEQIQADSEHTVLVSLEHVKASKQLLPQHAKENEKESKKTISLAGKSEEESVAKVRSVMKEQLDRLKVLIARAEQLRKLLPDNES